MICPAQDSDSPFVQLWKKQGQKLLCRELWGYWILRPRPSVIRLSLWHKITDDSVRRISAQGVMVFGEAQRHTSIRKLAR